MSKRLDENNLQFCDKIDMLGILKITNYYFRKNMPTWKSNQTRMKSFLQIYIRTTTKDLSDLFVLQHIPIINIDYRFVV